MSAKGEKNTRQRERERVRMNKKENIRGIFSQLTHLFSRKVGSCASRCGSYKFESPLLPPLEAIKILMGKEHVRLKHIWELIVNSKLFSALKL